MSFYFSLKVLLQYSCWADLLVTSYFSFYLSGNVLFSPLFLKDCFAGYSILGWLSFYFLFTFSTLNILSHCLLTKVISDAKSAFNFVYTPLYVIVIFHLLLSEFFVLEFWQFY